MPVFGLVLWVTIFVIGFIIGLIVLIYIGLKGFRKINKEVNAEFQNRCKWCGAYFESELEVHKPCPLKKPFWRSLMYAVGKRSEAERKEEEKFKAESEKFKAKKEQEEKEMRKPGKMPKDWKPEEPDN